jgi:hypothetical protein
MTSHVVGPYCIWRPAKRRRLPPEIRAVLRRIGVRVPKVGYLDPRKLITALVVYLKDDVCQRRVVMTALRKAGLLPP